MNISKQGRPRFTSIIERCLRRRRRMTCLVKRQHVTAIFKRIDSVIRSTRHWLRRTWRMESSPDTILSPTSRMSRVAMLRKPRQVAENPRTVRTVQDRCSVAVQLLLQTRWETFRRHADRTGRQWGAEWGTSATRSELCQNKEKMSLPLPDISPIALELVRMR